MCADALNVREFQSLSEELPLSLALLSVLKVTGPQRLSVVNQTVAESLRLHEFGCQLPLNKHLLAVADS